MSDWKEISAQLANEKIESQEVGIVDIRDLDSYYASHIADAIALNEEDGKAEVAALAKDQPLIVYCYHGNSSKGAASYFSAQGFKEVYSMAGGFEMWYQNYPTEP